MLLFMPWCPIDRQCDVGDLKIISFAPGAATCDVDDEIRTQLETILASYKTIEGRRIPKAALIKYRNKSLIDDLTDEEINVAYDLATLACFSGLAAKDYFDPLGAYCNTDAFRMYVQNFQAADFTALTTRRRDGSQLNAWPIDSIAITVPLHCVAIREVSIDADLLGALSDHRATCGNAEWGRWQNSISCFNQANTDSETFRYQAEWVLLCSSFEHLLGARASYTDVATRFMNELVPTEELLVRDASRRSADWRDENRPVRYEWMKEFYRIRGDFAHGRLNTQQPTVWTPHEHLLLGTIAFPLLVKTLLVRLGRYRLSDEDQVQRNAFERFADTPEFLNPPLDQHGGLDSYWRRAREHEQRNLRVAEAVRLFEEIRRQRAAEQTADDPTSDQL